MPKHGRTEWESTVAALALDANVNSRQSGSGSQVNAKKKVTRHSDRRRAAKTRKFVDFGDEGWNNMSYTAMCRLDRLEESADGPVDDAEDDDEEYGEDDVEDSRERKKKATAKKWAKNKARKNARGKTQNPLLKVQSLSHTLSTDLQKNGLDSQAYLYIKSAAPPPKGPPPHTCPVTGYPSRYTDPQTGVRYYDADALDKIRDKVPEWIRNREGGGCEYFGALKEGKIKCTELEEGGG